MNNLNIFEGKTLVVGSGTNYMVLKQTVFNNKVYLFANELLSDESPSDTIAILRVDTDEENVLITVEKDQNIVKALVTIFSEMIINS